MAVGAMLSSSTDFLVGGTFGFELQSLGLRLRKKFCTLYTELSTT